MRRYEETVTVNMDVEVNVSEVLDDLEFGTLVEWIVDGGYSADMIAELDIDKSEMAKEYIEEADVSDVADAIISERSVEDLITIGQKLVEVAFSKQERKYENCTASRLESVKEVEALKEELQRLSERLDSFSKAEDEKQSSPIARFEP